MQKRITWCILSIHHKGWCWGSRLFQTTRFTTFFQDSWISVILHTFCLGSIHKETSSFSKLLVLLFTTVLLASLSLSLCLLLRTVNVCSKPCHAFFAHFPRNLTIKKSLKFRCHFEWISPWKCRESVRWWRSLWVSLSARSRFGPAQATLNLDLRRFSRIRPDYYQVSNSEKIIRIFSINASEASYDN